MPGTGTEIVGDIGTPGIWTAMPGGCAGARAGCTCAAAADASEHSATIPDDRRIGLTPLAPVTDVARRFIVYRAECTTLAHAFREPKSPVEQATAERVIYNAPDAHRRRCTWRISRGIHP